MKNRAGKLIGILLLVMGLFLAAGCGSKAGESETQETEAQQERVTIYFFHNNPCESCHEGQKIRELAEKVMEGRENPIHYQTEEYYAFRTDGKQKLERLADELGIPDEDLSFPMVIIGNRWVSGYTRIEEELYDCLAEAAGRDTESSGAGEKGSSEEAGGNPGEKAGREGLFAATEGEKDSMNILLFTTESCSSCDKVKAFLKELPTEMETEEGACSVNIQELSVMEEENAVYLLQLYEARQVPVALQKVPFLFIGNRYLSGEKEIRSGLEALMKAGEGIGADYNPEIPVDSEAGKNKFTGIASIGTVVVTGFLNGLNPCALSMTLLFLSLLAAAGGRFLRYGLCYLAGKFLAYLGLGMAVAAAASSIPMDAFGTARNILNVLLLIFCLGAAFGNLWDFVQVKKGNFGRVRMQLPRALRRWNEKMMQAAVRPGMGKLLFLAVFGGSVVIALGEFFCTGQIYLASILQWVQSAPGEGVPFFVFCLYIAAMCIPALLIIILVAGGKSVFALSEKSLQRMPAVKLLYAVLFLAFALFSLYMLI